MRPKTLRILGMDWEIIIDNEAAAEFQALGQTHHQFQRILLSGLHKPQQQKLASLHEVGHATEGYYCAKDRLKEEQISRFTTNFFQVMRDNPEWVRWLIEDDALSL